MCCLTVGVVDACSRFVQLVLKSAEIKDDKKADVCIKIAEAEKCLVDGSDEYLQLMDVCGAAMKALKK
eukprot:scaffold184_cov379-Prasinococcus_capsulatus_cf.AAC.3